jgi:hypothetical protein
MELEFSEIKARAAGGEITGRFSMRPGDPESPFNLLVNFRDLEADRILSEAKGPRGMLHGRLEGNLSAMGNTADPNALSGAGEIHLRDGQVRQYSLLVALGQLLRIDELSQLQFDEAQVKYHITPGVVTIDELVLSSSSIRVSAVGTISFTGELKLDSQLAINDKIRKQLFRPIRDNFEPTAEDGYAALKFEVGGTVERPRTNLVDKLVGSELKDLGGVISSFLGGGKRERKKKPRDKVELTVPVAGAPVEEVAPPAEPEAPAAPPAPNRSP